MPLPLWYTGMENRMLAPPPVAPLPFQTVSLLTRPVMVLISSDVPPTAVTLGSVEG